MEVQILHLVSVGVGDGRSSHYYWVGVGFQASHEVPTDTALAGRDNTPHYCAKHGLKWLRQHVCMCVSVCTCWPKPPRQIAHWVLQERWHAYRAKLMIFFSEHQDLIVLASCRHILNIVKHARVRWGTACSYHHPWKEKAKDVEHRRALLTGDQCHYW